MSDTTCEYNPIVHSQYSSITASSLDSSQLINLSAGQYMKTTTNNYAGVTNESYSFVIACDNWGAAQPKTREIMRVASPTAYNTINKSNIINWSSGFSYSTDDKNDDIDIFSTNIAGLFYTFTYSSLTGNVYVPSERETTSTLSSKVDSRPTVYVSYLVNSDFRGIPEGATIAPTTSVTTFEWFDANEPASSRHVLNNSTSVNSIPGENFKMSSVCNYSLSDNGIVDFGDQNLSKVTNNRTTTVKKPLTLYMKDCYGVNKVKTYITNATTTLENGLLLGNTQTTNAATNVAIGINVAASSAKNSENNGSPMYMDGSNPLEWEFGNQYTVDPISKEIPLDVFLLSSGGEPTTGDFRATATIMMDFI
nr:fimbrial protein [Rahnella aquatilis]